jgi:hypothetical protein
MAIWSISHTLGIFYVLLVCFAIIWNIFPQFGMLHLEKSGNPGLERIGQTPDELLAVL